MTALVGPIQCRYTPRGLETSVTTAVYCWTDSLHAPWSTYPISLMIVTIPHSMAQMPEVGAGAAA